VTAIKVCGLTRREDVEAAVELGAVLLGFNFVATSPRRIAIGTARELAASARPALAVGVFAGEDDDTILRAIEETPLDLVQLHRRVTEEDLAWCSVPIIAAAPPEKDSADAPAPEMLSRLYAVLWDASQGSGTPADWRATAARGALPVRQFLAGGLHPDNVAEAIRRVRPHGVDVASGVESAPGVKDRARLARFFAAVREADLGA
jgi:phosphoribosylanthranilate isomerase